MGHSSKKKKKRSRGRAPAKDHSSLSAEDQELLAEELTAFLFDEDIMPPPRSRFDRVYFRRRRAGLLWL